MTDSASQSHTINPDALRTLALRPGLSSRDFEAVLNAEDVSFQDVFSSSTLLIVEFDVVLLGEHSHLVYIPERGEQCEALTSYPDRGRLRAGPPMPWSLCRHSPLAKPGRHRMMPILQNMQRSLWAELCDLAAHIDKACLNYNFLRQNSNSVTATLLDHLGLKYVDLKGGGINPGAGNKLHDELAGAPQPRRLLFRNGGSYLGRRNITMTESLDRVPD